MTADLTKQDEKNTALRYDNSKLRFDLIPPEAIIELARVYTAGAQKYKEDNNWRKGMDWSRCVGSMDRHINKWKMGLEFDPETTCHHLAQVAWNALTLMIYQMQNLGKDDRVIPERMTVDEGFNWTSVEGKQCNL